METLKQIKEGFAEELYSGESNKDYPDDHMKHKNNINDYILELEKCNPEGEEQNFLWEAGYVRGYEVALRDLLSMIQTDEFESKQDVIYDINYLLNN